MVLSGCAKRREIGAAMAVAPVAAVAAYLNKALHLTPRAAAHPGERSPEFVQGKVNFEKAVHCPWGR